VTGINAAACRGRTAIFGPQHPQAMQTLAECDTAASRHTKALVLARETLAERQEVLSPDRSNLFSLGMKHRLVFAFNLRP
jgi:hypothetical protein